MRVSDAMSEVVLTLGPGHTMQEAARQLGERNVGAVVIIDPESPGVGILTERDVVRSVGRGEDPEVERVGQHLTSDVVFAEPGWDLDQAAQAMLDGGFRHLIVTDGGEVVGMLSVRDVVRVWAAASRPTSTA